MRSSRAFLSFLLVSAPTAVVAVSSCGGGGNTTPSGSSSSSGAGGSRPDGGKGGSGGSGGNIFDTDAGCSTSADCNGGVCVDGVCCDAAANVCGSQCCKGGTVCLFDSCVTPGKDCHTANDCDPGQYCETALGGDDAGAPDAGPDASCTEALPLGGKCLPLPPVCDPDGGSPGADAGCVSLCEYHPSAGKLNAVAKWTWGPTAQEYPKFTDVWATPVVGRIYDGNCDGKVDELDAPSIVFVSGNNFDANGVGTNCQGAVGLPSTGCLSGVLRMLDGKTGKEIWSLRKASASSVGFAGLSVAIGDVDGDGRMDIAAVTGEGLVVLIDANGNVTRTSDLPIPAHTNATFGWGGGLSIADMDGDGFPEIAYGPTVYSTTNGKITLLFSGKAGTGGEAVYDELSTFVDLDGAPDNHLELLAGRTAYKLDGTSLWDRSDLPQGFPGVGDFDKDGKPEAVLVGQGSVWILDGATGKTVAGPLKLPGTGGGGPPTVADFDGDGKPEIGVAMANFYSMLKPDIAGAKINVVWQVVNHDLSSSVTGSSVFDFEGDGKAEVIYGDECFLWVFDGQTGNVRFATPHTSFTATEASLVADVDGDGRSEILMVSNGADPSSKGWGCDVAPWNKDDPDPLHGHPAWVPPPGAPAYRGVAAFGDQANSWVGTRTLWSAHTYHVSNICDDRDTACDPPNVYGSIPKVEKRNWTLPWLDNFRQNVQDKGIFDAPDATVSLTVDCSTPLVGHAYVRNIGLASLPAPVDVGIYAKGGGGDVLVGKGSTTHALFPGQTEEVIVSLDPSMSNKSQSFVAKIIIDPNNPKFHECREDNDESQLAKPGCVQ